MLKKQKSRGSISAKRAMAMFDELMSRPAQVPENFCSEVDRGLKYDPMRRIALVWLSKPFKEWVENIQNDRRIAVAFTAVAQSLDPVIERFKSLVELLEAAKAQMELAVCMRPDTDSVREEAGRSMSEGSWIDEFARRHEDGEDAQDILNEFKARDQKITH